MPENVNDTPSQQFNRFNNIVEMYERTIEVMTVHFARAALKQAGVQAKDQLLDVGGGTGALAVQAAEAGMLVTAVDISPAMVSRMIEKLQGFPESNARVMDGQNLSFPNNRFDASFSMFAVMMFPDWRKGLSELMRVTRPGGCVGVATWINPVGSEPLVLTMDALHRTFPDAQMQPPPAGAVAMQTADGLRTEMERAGCVNVKVQPVKAVCTLVSVAAAVSSMESYLAATPMYAALDETGREQAHEAVQGVMKRYEDAEGAVKVTVQGNVATGVKAK